MSIQKISKEDIDFSKVYGTRADAKNQQNSVHVNEVYWGDNGELTVDFDDETNTGAVKENGVVLGYINRDSLITSIDTFSSTGSVYNGSYRDESDIMKKTSNDEKTSGVPQEYQMVEESFDMPDEDYEEIQPIITSEELMDSQDNFENMSDDNIMITDSPFEEVDQDDLDIGEKISIPPNIPQTGIIENYTNYDYFYGRWNNGSAQKELSEVWAAAGKPNDRGIATINGRYLVAVSKKFGKVGDSIDVCLDNGEVIPCMIADAKGPDAESEWGHLFGRAVDIIEWESMGDQDVIDTEGWYGCKVDSIINRDR